MKNYIVVDTFGKVIFKGSKHDCLEMHFEHDGSVILDTDMPHTAIPQVAGCNDAKKYATLGMQLPKHALGIDKVVEYNSP